MSRIRQSLLRRPALLLSWVLLALTSQALAMTLDWCLHGEAAHVELVAAPHHGESPAAVHEDCHGADSAVSADAATAGCEGLMFSVVVDGAVKAAVVPDFEAAPAFILSLLPALDPPAASSWLASRARATMLEPPPHSRIAGVLAGTSTRLLI
jgi:hypothetical protein